METGNEVLNEYYVSSAQKPIYKLDEFYTFKNDQQRDQNNTDTIDFDQIQHQIGLSPQQIKNDSEIPETLEFEYQVQTCEDKSYIEINDEGDCSQVSESADPDASNMNIDK